MHLPCRQPRPVWQSHAVLHAAPSPPRSGSAGAMVMSEVSPPPAVAMSESPPPPTESGLGDVQPIQVSDATTSRYRMGRASGPCRPFAHVSAPSPTFGETELDFCVVTGT